MLTKEIIEQYLEYDPETGICKWKDDAPFPNNLKPKFCGKVAGTKNPDTSGYIAINIVGSKCRLHKIIWLLMTGEWCKDEIDHCDRDKLNNRWNNLRKATKSQNQWNKRTPRNTSGYHGVCYVKNTNKWRARIRVNWKELHLGDFENKEEAAVAYNNAAIQYHGEYAILNEVCV